MSKKIELKNHQHELYSFQVRLLVLGGFVFFFILILFSRFFYLQVMQHDHYQLLAEKNRINIIPLAPQRGKILDNNGKIFADNFAAYTLEITPSAVTDVKTTVEKISKIIKITKKDLKNFNKRLEMNPEYSSVPLKIKLNDSEIAMFAARKFLHPGVDIKARLFRNYPNNEIGSHVLGYIGKINKEEYEKIKQNGYSNNYIPSDDIGKSGIEKKYENYLRGITGWEHIETDATGRSIRTIKSTQPTPGNNLYLSIDMDVQLKAEEVFKGKKGALIAINPKTGGIITFVSKPGFNPNFFIEGIDAKIWNAWNNSPDLPLNNRAIMGQYPPGSTFKPFMALAAVESGKRDWNYKINDPGSYTLGSQNHVFRDWKEGGHGIVDLKKAIVQSCDTYFYELSNLLGINHIHDYISEFGFGKKTGIDLDGEVEGLLPSKEWKKKRFNQSWFVGDTISVGIGQGYNLSTPLQLVVATSTIANGGYVIQPYLVETIKDYENKIIYKAKRVVKNKIKINKKNLKLLNEAMVGVMLPGGTAAQAGYNTQYVFAGKTGTAQVIGMKGQKYDEEKILEKYRDHALFVGYAPVDDPRIAIAVVVENGGHGGSTAAPMARKVIDEYLEKINYGKSFRSEQNNLEIVNE